MGDQAAPTGRPYAVVITGGECDQATDGRPCVVGVIVFSDRAEAKAFMDRLPPDSGEVAHFMAVHKPDEWLPPPLAVRVEVPAARQACCGSALIPAARLLVTPCPTWGAVGGGNIGQAPPDLGCGAGLPVRPGGGHLRAGERLRDAVGP